MQEMHALLDVVEPSHYHTSLNLGLDVDLMINLGRQAIFVGLAVLTHHDDRCRIGGLERER